MGLTSNLFILLFGISYVLCQSYWMKDKFFADDYVNLDDFYKSIDDEYEYPSVFEEGEDEGENADDSSQKATSYQSMSKGAISKHDHEEGKKGDDEKELASNDYEESEGHEWEGNQGEESESGGHKEDEGKRSAGKTDARKSKSKGYTKGWDDKYNMEELKKHDSFWSNSDSLDKYKVYGASGLSQEEGGGSKGGQEETKKTEYQEDKPTKQTFHRKGEGAPSNVKVNSKRPALKILSYSQVS